MDWFLWILIGLTLRRLVFQLLSHCSIGLVWSEQAQHDRRAPRTELLQGISLSIQPSCTSWDFSFAIYVLRITTLPDAFSAIATKGAARKAKMRRTNNVVSLPRCFWSHMANHTEGLMKYIFTAATIGATVANTLSPPSAAITAKIIARPEMNRPYIGTMIATSEQTSAAIPNPWSIPALI